MSAHMHLHAVVDDVNASFVARDEVLDQAHYSLVDKCHALLIGTSSASNSVIVGAHLIRPDG